MFFRPQKLPVVLKCLAALIALLTPLCVEALSFSNRYRSPRNPERPLRKSTRLIVLHTTEAGARSSLNKLSERGEAHYCIDEKGVVHRIVDKDREAFHAGRSMWCGHEDCDNHSVGIEVVGHHDKPVTLAQLDAIRDLVAELKKYYRLGDNQVVCHSHVAYGAPNKWHRRKHRGRKRCGMLFAMPSVRERLGLRSKPAYDPDVRAKRLVVGDKELERVLYGKVDTMAGRLGRNVHSSNRGWGMFFSKKPPERTNEPEREDYYAKPKAAISAIKSKRKPVMSARPVSKPNVKPVAKSGQTAAVSKEPKTLRDLENRSAFFEMGVVGVRKTPYAVAGALWNSSKVYYYSKGAITRGDRMNPRRISAGTRVFKRK